MRRLALLLTAALVALTACTYADPTASPSTDATVPPAAELEEFARRAVEQGAPAVVLQVRNGDQETVKAAGVRGLDSREPAETTDKLWISGAGTPMVAVAVLKLVEDGTIALDSPVAGYLPEFAAIFPDWDQTTIRELLGSRTGLPDYVPVLVDLMPVDEQRTTALSYEQRLRMAAGSGAQRRAVADASWSATDWEVLAWMLERIHARALAEVLHHDVFVPAGMSSTLVAPVGPPPEPMLHAYVQSGGRRVDFTRIDAFAGSGDAGIISTVEDVGRFVASLTAGRLIGKEMTDEMVHGSRYPLGGIRVHDELCPGKPHASVAGGGGPYSIMSFSSLDGRQQVAAAMTLPPADPDPTRIPPLVIEMEDAVRSTAQGLC